MPLLSHDGDLFNRCLKLVQILFCGDFFPTSYTGNYGEYLLIIFFSSVLTYRIDLTAESYKFARLFPLNQRDLPHMGNLPLECFHSSPSEKEKDRIPTGSVVEIPENVKVDNPPCDFTPAKFITLLFTDLGVLTPSAVSDELIKLYS